MFDPDFSVHSYGFRPGQSAHQALLHATANVAAGRRRGDLDPGTFFDRVHHDVLMSRVGRRVRDSEYWA